MHEARSSPSGCIRPENFRHRFTTAMINISPICIRMNPAKYKRICENTRKPVENLIINEWQDAL